MSGLSSTITQKGYSARLGKIHKEFIFQENELIYSTADRTGKKTIHIPYESINLKKQQTVFVSSQRVFIRALLLYFFFGIFIINAFQNHLNAGQLAFAITVLIGAGMAVLMYKTRGGITYTIIDAENDRLHIIHDGQQDTIVDQIKAYRIARLRQLYAKVDMTALPEKEKSKFAWLKNNGIIDDTEYADALKSIDAMLLPPKSPNQIN